jgi:peroxiredoxin
MEKLKKTNREKGIEIIGISVLGKDRETVEKIAAQEKTGLRILLDPEGDVVKRYGGEHLPGT